MKRLRILTIVDLPWDARLGASRVFIALADAWREAGHEVSKYCLTDAFPTPSGSGISSALRQLRFRRKAAEFVRRHASEFDVIDCLLGTLPFSKSELHFKGLLVGRSVGLYRLYRDFDRISRARWPAPNRGTLAGRFIFRWAEESVFRASDRSVRVADVVNVPNEAERTVIHQTFGTTTPVVVQPYGLTDSDYAIFSAAAAPAATRQQRKKISFVGAWSPRKGSKDWGTIIRRIRASVPEAEFIFLGTLTDDANVWRDLELDDRRGITVVREFAPEDLPRLLSDCTAGGFPSYAEGFGLAVVEQLAAGIPTVSYDSPGPAEILRSAAPDLLVNIWRPGGFRSETHFDIEPGASRIQPAF